MAASRAALLLLVCFVSAATTAENTCDSKVDRDSCGSASAGSSAEETQEHQRPANMERTFLMIKPDGVQRGLVGEIIRRFETKGYKLVAFKFMQATEDMLANHYAEHKERTFYDGLLKYIMSGPVVPMVWEGTAVVKTCRNIIGVTNPLNASPGTIRGDYGIDMGRNIIHGSDSEQSAQREISIWFTDEELVDWESNQSAWVYE